MVIRDFVYEVMESLKILITVDIALNVNFIFYSQFLLFNFLYKLVKIITM